MYVLAAAYLPSAALRGSGLVARALLRADLFEPYKKGNGKPGHRTSEAASPRVGRGLSGLGNVSARPLG